MAADLEEPDVGQIDDYVQSELRTLEREDPLASEDAEAPSHVRLETERGRFLRAPVVVAVL